MGMNRQYGFNVHPDNSPEIFKEVSAVIERGFPDFEKKKLLIDVDGSTIQVFARGNEEIIVFDDYDVGAVYIESDVDVSGTIYKTPFIK